MGNRWLWTAAAVGCGLVLSTSCPREEVALSSTVPFVLDHNRMLIDAEFQRADGSWRKARLWVDTGNPELFLSEELAHDLGIDLSAPLNGAGGGTGQLEVAPPTGVRVGGMPLRCEGVATKVLLEPRWLFKTMAVDANLPATLLKRYHVVFDYPRSELTLAEPGTLEPRGERCTAAVHPTTGIVQIDATIDGESMSFALDNGASYSFASEGLVSRIADRNASWPRRSGAVGCANIWGWWPDEPTWPIVRLPEIRCCGSVRLADVGMVGLPDFMPNGASVGEWYSQKTARPVAGFLGPNAFRAFRVEVDYANGAVYFERGAEPDAHDMDIVGLTLRPRPDGAWVVIGVAAMNGARTADGVDNGDILLEVDGLEVTGSTMGTVVDALRGDPGDTRTLVLERHGDRITVQATVERLL
jgi:hypothetical protein